MHRTIWQQRKQNLKESQLTQERRKTQIKLRRSYLHVTQEWDHLQWGATKFRNRVKAQRPDLTVINTSVDNIPADCDIAVVQAVLADRARKSAPQAQLVIINNFLQDPNLDGLYEQMTAKVDASAQTAAAVEEVETPVATGNTKILVEEGIKTGLNQSTNSKRSKQQENC